MPTSTGAFIQGALIEIMQLRPQSVLDVGCGFGLWGFLCRLYLDVFEGRPYKEDWQVHIEAIEVFPKYIMPHQEFIYDRIRIGAIEELMDELDHFDLFIFGDVLEHMTKHDAVRVLEEAYERANKGILINVPLGDGWLRDGTDDNPYEAHLSVWEFDDFFEYCPKVCGEAHFPNVGRYGALLIDKTLTVGEKAHQMYENGRLYTEWNPEAAARCFTRAIEMGYDKPDAHLELANMLLQEQNMEDAVAILRAAVSRFPEYSPTYDTLSQVLQMLNRVDEAREILNAKPSPPAAR